MAGRRLRYRGHIRLRSGIGLHDVLVLSGTAAYILTDEQDFGKLTGEQYLGKLTGEQYLGKLTGEQYLGQASRLVEQRGRDYNAEPWR